MAVRGWGGSIATATGVAAGVGAAQLGFGYGLGIVTWTATDVGSGPLDAALPEAIWTASLAWSTWIAATSTVAGAVVAQRLSRRPTGAAQPSGSAGAAAQPRRPVGALPVALASALGALVAVLLVTVPARAATPPDSTAPQQVAAGYAAAGVLLGLVVAIWALRSPPAAGVVVATVGWTWLLAVVAVVDGVLAGRGLTSTPLGAWQISADRPGFWWGDHLYWPAALLSLLPALVIGALAARRAARSTYRRVGAAAAGAAGPLLVAVAHLLVTPRLTEVGGARFSAQLVAPYAVLAGLAGSVLVAAWAQRRDAATAAGPTTATANDAHPVDAATDAHPADPATDPADAATDAVAPATAGPTAVAAGPTGPTGVPTGPTGDPTGPTGDPIATATVPTSATDPSATTEPAPTVDSAGTVDSTPAGSATPPTEPTTAAPARVPRPRRRAPGRSPAAGAADTPDPLSGADR
ncbi:hypothetical protein O7606_18860 [Micromonospora sp. WMMD882]|uniref:hypothetical protein n=1 Tax=Micromonospora sp. WMMD882 TaxID=3015151 RepID=UPI00248C9C5E|nr:hypothetical protein [Micromonospora sp. WMMD882]WBB78282.1 hypothetical protein O7606_18860 [Micromonospora sp. WMMD882]